MNIITVAGHRGYASRGHAPSHTALMVLLLCGIASPIIYAGTDILAASMYAGFSYADNAVSELFAIGAPTSRMVVALFTLSSALLLPFAYAIWLASGHRAARRGLALTIAASAVVSLVLWNAFPMHMRGTEFGFTDTMHLILATNPFVPASWIFGAVAFRGWFRGYTLVTVAVVLALAFYGFSFAPEVAANEPTPWMGLAERAGQYAGGLWQVVLAVALRRELAASERDG